MQTSTTGLCNAHTKTNATGLPRNRKRIRTWGGYGSAPLAQYFSELIKKSSISDNKQGVALEAIRNSDVDLFLHANPIRYKQDRARYHNLNPHYWHQLSRFHAKRIQRPETIAIKPLNNVRCFIHTGQSRAWDKGVGGGARKSTQDTTGAAR